MKSKNFVLAVFAFVVLGCVVVALINRRIQIHHAADPIAGSIIDWQKPIGVKKINVLTGNEFDLILEDDRRIHAFLRVKATPDAKPKIIEFLNHCLNPRAILIEEKKEESYWIVRMYVTIRDSSNQLIEIDLAKWLQEKQLAYN